MIPVMLPQSTARKLAELRLCLAELDDEARDLDPEEYSTGSQFIEWIEEKLSGFDADLAWTTADELAIEMATR